MPESLKILLVEDDWSVRSAVRDYLTRRGMVVSEADCLAAALTLAETIRPDVAIVDIVLPEQGGERADFDKHVGIQVARQLCNRFPEMGVVFLSAYVDRGPEVIQLFMEGHERIVYLLKGSKPKDLLEAIDKVSNGATALEIAAGVRTAHQKVFAVALALLTDEERACMMTALGELSTLSDQERRVFEAIGRCRTRKQAAKEMSISVKTISGHMDTIYGKLGLREENPGLNPLTLLAKIHMLHHLLSTESDERADPLLASHDRT